MKDIEIKQRTYALINRVGTTRDKVIPLLQAIQQEFNYLPADALDCVYERTDIDLAQLLSVATFSIEYLPSAVVIVPSGSFNSRTKASYTRLAPVTWHAVPIHTLMTCCP